MSKFFKFILTTIGMLWMLSIVGLYFFELQPVENCPRESTCVTWNQQTYHISPNTAHRYYLDAITSSTHLEVDQLPPQWNPLYGIVLTLLVLYLLWWSYRRWWRKEKELKVRLSPLDFVLLFSLVFGVVAVNWFSFYQLLNQETPFTGIFSHYAGILGFLGIVLLTTIAAGAKLLKWLKYTENTHNELSHYLLCFATGSIVLVALLFGLGILEQLSGLTVWGVVLILLLISYQEVWQAVKDFVRKSVSVETSFWSPQVGLLFLFFLIAGHNLLEIIRPIPLGFDDLALYMNIPQLLSQTGHLLSGIDSYSWGLFMSLGFLLFHSATLAMLLSWLGGILVFLGLFAVGKEWGKAKGLPQSTIGTYALLIGTLFYSLPTVVFQSAKDMKVDLAAMFFCIMAWLLFQQALQTPPAPALSKSGTEGALDKKIWFSAALLGFAFTIKYTALLFAVVVGILMLMELIRKKIGWGKGIQILIVWGFFFLLPFLPYAVKNIAASGAAPLSVNLILKGPSSAPNIVLDPPLGMSTVPTTSNTSEEATTSTWLDKILPSGAQGEFQRYLGAETGWNKYLLLPFTITLHPISRGLYVDIGYVFLALVPLVLLVYSGMHQKDRPQVQRLIGVGALYWILWGVLAQGVIWYGYAGFIFLVLLIVEILSTLQEQQKTWLAYWSHLTIILWFICSLFLRTAFLPEQSVYVDPLNVAYARGVFNEESYLAQKIPTYTHLVNRINQEIDHPTEGTQLPKVYRVGTFIKYFLHRNDELVLDDNQLDVFANIYADKDDLKTIQRFKNSGFKYLIIDTNTPSIDKTSDRFISQRYSDLIALVRNHPDRILILLDAMESGIVVAEVR